MTTLKKITLAFVLLMIGTIAHVAAKPFAKPDFAFPKKVSKQAEIELKNSLISGNDLGALRALINLSLSEGMVDSESLPKAYQQITDARQKLTDPGVVALTYIVQAQILKEVYFDKRYTYDERKLPLAPMADDWTEWSGDQFKKEINRLLDLALSDKDMLSKEKIGKYVGIITMPDQTEIYYPSLLDFVISQAIETINRLDNIIPSTLPADMINRITSASKQPLSAYNNPEATKILELYSTLMHYNEGRYAPFLHAVFDCVFFVGFHVYPDQEMQMQSNAMTFLQNLYNEYFPVTEYAGDILIDGFDLISAEMRNKENENRNQDTRRRMLLMLKSFIERYPQFWRINQIKSFANDLVEPEVAVRVPNAAEPGMAFSAIVEVDNIDEAFVKVYRMKRNDTKRGMEWVLASTTPVAQQKVGQKGELPYSYSESATFILPDPGRYFFYATLSADDNPDFSKNGKSNGTEVICTSVGLASINNANPYIYSFNPATGQPVGNVGLKFERNKSSIDLGETDKNGFTRLNPASSWPRNLTVRPILGEDIYGFSTSVNILEERPESKDILESVSFTDLPLYHPGDTVRWESVVYLLSPDKSKRRPIGNYKLKAFLYNTNYVISDSLELTTDDFGRCSGQFLIATGELTGNHHITLAAVSSEAGMVQRCNFDPVWFMVSDYKLPTFMIELDKPQINLPATGDATLKGRVVSYSGVGLANTDVKLSVKSMSRFRYRYSGGDAFFIDSVKTDSDGSFTLLIPAIAMDYSEYPDGRFQCNITATSLSGESQSNQTSFARGKLYSITAALTNSISANYDFDITKPIEIKIKVIDAEDKDVDTSVCVTIMKSDEIVYSDTLPCGDSKLNLNCLQPDVYEFRFSLVDPEMKAVADSINISYITLFDPNGKKSPSKAGIWACNPKSNHELKKGEKATFYYAVPTNNSYFIYTLSSGKKVYESRWIKADAGVHKMTVDLPDSVENAKIELVAFRDFKESSKNLSLYIKEEKLQLKCESFRDKLIPGSTETWRFRTITSGGAPERSAMIMTMFNESLNSLQSLSYNGSFKKWYNGEIWSNSSINSGNRVFYASISPNKFKLYSNIKRDFFTIPVPTIDTYNMSFLTKRYFRRSYPVMAKSSYGSVREVFEDVAYDFSDALAGQVSGLEVTSAPAEMNTLAYSDHSAVAEVEEEPRAEKTYTYMKAGAAQDNETDHKAFQYREEISPLAFFRPTLTTDANGELEFSFTVPNANTSWRLNAFAFTESLLSTSITRTFVANRPIMVTPNLPRFLRSGDKVDISALVVNNTDETQIVTTLCEMFDPLSGHVIKQYQTSDTIAAGGNSSVTIAVDAPTDAPTIGIRFKSSTNLYADGEQVLVRILPASQPVIETMPFYISPDSTHFEMSMPKIGNDARVTLEYCDNPTWYIVTALPGLRQEKISTADQATDAIFSAAIAAGMLRDYPAIDDALRQWTSSDRSDSTLVSMLERNADLKTVLLQATPWMVDAMTDTQRMERLALLFDKSEIESTIATAVEQLSRLQHSDGGWAWFSAIDEPSMWATSNALFTLGRLNHTGYLPADQQLRTMIEEAFIWYEDQISKQFKKYPRQSYIDFLMVADQWPEFKPTLTSKKIMANEIQLIIKNWKKYSVGGKSRAAILLAHNGYKKLGETILQSIYEFAKQTPEQGMWWPSVGEQYSGTMTELAVSGNILLATKEITPDSPNIDPIRQWLILQKEARNWESGAMTTDVIYAILSTSPKWVQRAAPTAITIGGAPLPVSYTDSVLGYLRADISDIAKQDSQLSIVKSDKTPAWGAIYSQSTRVMTEIESESCEAVSIEKRLYRQEGNNWVAADQIHVGDRVKIQLLIHANRAMEYLAITDNRAACLEPVEQLPKPIYSQGICFYRENRDSATNLFVTNMPKGTYMLEYEMWVNNAGTFSSGIATIQSQYAPQLSAHSSGSTLNVICR